MVIHKNTTTIHRQGEGGANGRIETQKKRERRPGVLSVFAAGRRRPRKKETFFESTALMVQHPTTKQDKKREAAHLRAPWLT